MPSLPRIRTRRDGPASGQPEVAQRPRVAELQHAGLTWIHLESPTQEEALALAARFGWHPLDVEDVMSRRQRPKVDVYTEEGEAYLFSVLHFPVYDKAIGRLNAGELDAFLGADYLVTLPAVELRPVSRLFRRCAENEEFRENLFRRGSGRLLYEVLDDLYDYCFPILDKIGYKLEQIDEELDEGDSKGLVRDIHKVKQEIISYRKIIKPQRPTLRQLERGVERFLPEDLELYFDDIVDASERIWDLLDNYKEVVEALESTNESVINHQQNDILYVLTIFSVVVLPLTFLTGLFGMNVQLPRLRQRRRVLVDPRLLPRRDRRHARLLPLQALAVASRRGAAVGALAARVRPDRGRDRRLHLLRRARRRRRGTPGRAPGRARVRAAEQVPVRVGAPARRAVPARRRTSVSSTTPRRWRCTGSARRASPRWRRSTAPDGFNLGWNVGRIAGAGIVDHGHLHVVPRWSGDTNFMPVLADVKVIPEHLDDSRRRLADAWPA